MQRQDEGNPKARDVPRRAAGGGLAVAVVASTAVVVRLAFVWRALEAEAIHGLFLDAAHYARLGAAIRSGAGAGDTPYLFSPLYPYFLALFPGVLGDPVGWAAVGPRVVQAFVGAGTALAAAFVAARLVAEPAPDADDAVRQSAGELAALGAGGKAGKAGKGDELRAAGPAAAGVDASEPASASRAQRAFWVAGLAVAVHAVLVHYDAGVLVASWQAFFLTSAFAVLFAADERVAAAVRQRRALCAGVLLGLSAALRPTGLAVGVVVFVGLLARRRRAAWSWALGIALAVLPFTVRNFVVGGEAVLLSANGGSNFWIGNHAGATGVYVQPPGFDFDRDPLATAAPWKELGREAGYAGASAWWRAKAWSDIAAEPGAWLGLLGWKLVLFLHPEELPQLGWSYAWVRAQTGPSGLPFGVQWVLLFALAAPLLRRLRHARSARVELVWLGLVAYTLAIVLFFVTGRYRAPIVPLALALAVDTCASCLVLLRRPSTRTRGRAALGGLVAFAVLLRGVYGATLALPVATGIEESQRGIALVAAGRFAEAVPVLEASLALADTDPTRAAHALALRRLGRVEEALASYRTIVERDPDEALAWFNLGNLYWEDLRRATEAEACFRRALERRPEAADITFNLGVVVLQQGRFAEAHSLLERALTLAPSDAPWAGEARKALRIAAERR